MSDDYYYRTGQHYEPDEPEEPTPDTAGRDLDRAVAERVMGREVWANEYGNFVVIDGTTDITVQYEVPHYSQDDSCAMQVVIRMAALGFWCRMQTPFLPLGKAFWAGFTPHGTTGWNGQPDHWTAANTLPEAICLAALKAVQA